MGGGRQGESRQRAYVQWSDRRIQLIQIQMLHLEDSGNRPDSLGQFQSTLSLRSPCNLQNAHLSRAQFTSFKIQNLNEKSDQQKHVTCSCKKTRCSKLYCECLANNRVCSVQCKCLDCCNKQNQQGIQALYTMMQKERGGILAANKLGRRVSGRGCNCKKSGCLKKYCECFNNGRGCSEQCRCQDCRNKSPTEGRVMEREQFCQRETREREVQLMKEIECLVWQLQVQEQEVVLDYLFEIAQSV